MPRIVVTLKKDGTINAEGFEFSGSSCEKAMEFLEDLFGEATQKERKPEFYLAGKETISSQWCG